MPSEEHEVASRATKWHQSGLSQITGCSRQWWLEHVAGLATPERVATLPGTAYHRAVELHERARMEGTKLLTQQDCLTIAAEVVEAGASDVPDAELAAAKLGKKTGLDAVIGMAHAAVRNFFEADVEYGPPIVEVLSNWTPLALEEYMSADLLPGARDLGGTVDGIYRDNLDQVRVIDHKTANSLSTWTAEGKGIEQATHYATLAVLSGVAEQIPPVDFLIVKKSPPRKGSVSAMVKTLYPSHNDVQMLGVTVRRAETTVEDNEFLPDPSWQWCRASSCPFYTRCVGGTRELAGPISMLGLV